MSLLTGESRTATVTAAGDCEVIEIGVDAFRAVVVADPMIVERVGAAVALRRAGLEPAPLDAGAMVADAGEAPQNLLARVRQFLRLSTAIPFLNAATSASVTATLTSGGLPPPLAARSGPRPRDPPDADTCADWRSGAAPACQCAEAEAASSSAPLSCSCRSCRLLAGAVEPVRPAAPSSTVAIAVIGVGSYLMFAL